MSSIFSSETNVKAEQEGKPEVIGVDNAQANKVFEALSSNTSRDILKELHEEPGTPSEIADKTDTSIQNIEYHLDKLKEADLIQVADTQYSPKGNEMNIYAPSDKPLLLFAGQEKDTSQFKDALKRFVGATGILAIISLAFQYIIDNFIVSKETSGVQALDTGRQMTEDTGGVQAITDILPPGALFFAGGLTILLIVSVWWYVEHKR